MAAVDFLPHENAPSWAGVEPATLGAEVQRQTNHATQPADAVIPKCLGGPPVNRDRRNAHPGLRSLYAVCSTLTSSSFSSLFSLTVRVTIISASDITSWGFFDQQGCNRVIRTAELSNAEFSGLYFVSLLDASKGVGEMEGRLAILKKKLNLFTVPTTTQSQLTKVKRCTQFSSMESN
ncbi:hypothetical protein TNCV_452521 [Trichonephila clavipes]|nr:hypothetical protein TNCV_452521 [Trichonephila clavipes]